MRVLYTFPFAALGLVIACSSTTGTTPGANDGGSTSADGGSPSDDPCDVPFMVGQNFIGNDKFKSYATRDGADRDVQWQLQGYNEMLMSLQDIVGQRQTLFDRLYPSCKKLAEDLGATGNEISRAADEPTEALKIKKTCALALQYVQATYDELADPPRHLDPYTCVAKLGDADACIKAYGATGAGATCQSAVDSNTKTPLVSGECKNGWIDPGPPCFAFPLAKMTCSNELGSATRPIYSTPAMQPGKRNFEVIEFMTNNPFFFPWNNEVRGARADKYEAYFTGVQAILEFGPPNLKPTCGQKVLQKIALIVGPFLEMQAFTKQLRATIGLPTP